MEAIGERDVADDDTEANRNQQHRLVLLEDGKADEEATDDDHDDVAEFCIGEAGVAPKLLETTDETTSTVKLEQS